MAVKNYNYNYSTCEQDGGIELINNAELLVKEMEHEVEKYTTLLKLAKTNRVRTLKENVDYIRYVICIPSVKRWISLINDKNEKIDKRKKNPDKDMFEYFTGIIKDDFFGGRNIKIINCLQGGYESYYTSLEIECEDNIFTLTIPNMENITVKNLEYANNGKIGITIKTGDHMWKGLKYSYEEEDIKNAIDNELSNGVEKVLL